MLEPGASSVVKALLPSCQPKETEPDLQRARAQDTRALILCHVARRDARAVGRLRLLLQHFHAVLTLRMRLAAFRLLALAKRLRAECQSVYLLTEAPRSKHCIFCVQGAAYVCACGCCPSNNLSYWRPAHALPPLSTLPPHYITARCARLRPLQRQCIVSQEPRSVTMRHKSHTPAKCSAQRALWLAWLAPCAVHFCKVTVQGPLLKQAPDAMEAKVTKAGCLQSETCAREAARASPLLAPRGPHHTPHPSCASCRAHARPSRGASAQTQSRGAPSIAAIVVVLHQTRVLYQQVLR